MFHKIIGTVRSHLMIREPSFKKEHHPHGTLLNINKVEVKNKDIKYP